MRRNIQFMVDKALATGVRLRPHFKTHQSMEVGAWFRETGIDQATVSSMGQASYFARGGWDDITVAVPINVGEIDEINRLAKAIQLGLLVDSEVAVRFLKDRLTARVRVWIKVDVGYGRVGVPWHQREAVIALAARITTSDKMTFAGLLTHAGHSYLAKNTDEILAINSAVTERMVGLRQALERAGIERFELSIGDTPCCSLADSFPGVDEIRPGNFVFYDAMQQKLGACTQEQIAVAVACPVIGVYPERRQVVIYGGAVHLSKEHLKDRDGNNFFGYVTRLGKDGFGPIDERLFVSNLSQEHGIITVAARSLIDDIHLGDTIIVLPIHACLTANLYAEYETLEGRIVPRREKN